MGSFNKDNRYSFYQINLKDQEHLHFLVISKGGSKGNNISAIAFKLGYFIKDNKLMICDETEYGLKCFKYEKAKGYFLSGYSDDDTKQLIQCTGSSCSKETVNSGFYYSSDGSLILCSKNVHSQKILCDNYINQKFNFYWSQECGLILCYSKYDCSLYNEFYGCTSALGMENGEMTEVSICCENNSCHINNNKFGYYNKFDEKKKDVSELINYTDNNKYSTVQISIYDEGIKQG